MRFFLNRIVHIAEPYESFFNGRGGRVTDILEFLFKLASEFSEIGFPADHVPENEKAADGQCDRNTGGLVVYDRDKGLKKPVDGS